MREVTDMAKSGDQRSGVEKRGGYEPGPKKVSELSPPPKNPGAGAKPSSGSSGSGGSQGSSKQ
jgi:hypothetical protein